MSDQGGPIFGFATAEVGNIYADPCQWELAPPLGPTVDDLVSAWANVPGLDATATRDVTVDGYPGKQIAFTVPNYNMLDCKGEVRHLAGTSSAWNRTGGRGRAGPGFSPVVRGHLSRRVLCAPRRGRQRRRRRRRRSRRLEARADSSFAAALVPPVGSATVLPRSLSRTSKVRGQFVVGVTPSSNHGGSACGWMPR